MPFFLQTLYIVLYTYSELPLDIVIYHVNRVNSGKT